MQRGGGIIIAVCLLVGAGIGVAVGQGSLGIVVGLVVGAALAGLMAWRDTRPKP
ncbi:MAG: hypothetical protein ACRYG4_02605 [Janthinobacterium lividum]